MQASGLRISRTRRKDRGPTFDRHAWRSVITMCHLVLVLPLIALPLLWLLPPTEGVSAYGAVVAVSAVVYAMTIRAMRMAVGAGSETLLHAIGVVRLVEGRQVSVFVHSELWSAEPIGDALAVGDRVEIVGREGLRLRVLKLRQARDTASQAERPRSGEAR